MKKVLLIGDSIRMGYMPHVQELLTGKAEVWGPEENCRFAKYTLWGIPDWLNEFGTPDIIHWNNGIWDGFKKDCFTEIFTPVDEYVRDMKRVYEIMKATGAKIIFATTTPVGDANREINNSVIENYNSKILEFINSENITVNDLYSFVRPDIDKYIAEDLLHLNDAGTRALGERVAAVIEKYL